jgi:hypothetical protein
MEYFIRLLPGQFKGGPAVAGFHRKRFRGNKERRFLFRRKLEPHGFRHDLLDIHAIGPGQGHIPRDEFGQFLGFGVSGREGGCVWGEVFEGFLADEMFQPFQ